MITWFNFALLLLQCIGVTLQAVTALLIAVGFYVAYGQLKATVAANKASNFFDLVGCLQRQEVRDARKKVHNLEDYRDWRDKQNCVEAAQQVGSSFDIAAVAMKSGLIEPRVFAEPWKTAICSTYDIIKDYIKERQQKTRDRMYLAHYVGLARLLKGEPPGPEGPYGVPFPGRRC